MVKKIIGKVVEPIGFQYEKGDIFWCFYREKNDIKQEIQIYDYYKKNLRINFWTDAYGQSGIGEVKLVSDKNYQGDILDEHPYETEEEFKTLIEGFRELIIKYGLDALEKISVPTTNARPKPETDLYLFENHSRLAKEYKETLQIDMTNEIRIPKNLRLFSKEIYNLQNQKFEDVEYILVGYAALYGEIIITNQGGEWVYRDKKCFIDYIANDTKFVYPLNVIISLWTYGKDGISDNDLYNEFR